MLFSLLYFLVGRFLGTGRRSREQRDIELLVLRHQVRVLQHQVKRPRLRRLDRLLLAAASRAMPRGLWSSFVVRPETLLRWHRELVRRKLKLDLRVSATTVRTTLLRRGLYPAPRRIGPTWSEFLRSQAAGILACDFFTVETLRLKTLYVLFFIELSTRRVHLVEATACPDSAWVTQQARNLATQDRLTGIRFLLRDRDAKFSGPFDEVFRTEEVRVIRTPIRAPKANAFAERFVRTVRSECMDHVLIYGRRHLDRVLRVYVSHYMEQRPHRELGLATPCEGSPWPARQTERSRIDRSEVLGGLIHEYGWVA